LSVVDASTLLMTFSNRLGSFRTPDWVRTVWSDWCGGGKQRLQVGTEAA
jgi:hypothetical protein